MLKRRTDKTAYAVHSIRTLQETEDIVMSTDPVGLSAFLLRLTLSIIVGAANLAIRLLQRLLFKGNGVTTIDFQNIVVYSVGIVGDNVVMLLALAAIRRRYPKAFITVITNCQIWNSQGAREVLESSAFKDRLIIINEYPVERRGLGIVFHNQLFPDVKCDLFINLSPFGNRGWIGAVIKEMIFAHRLGARSAVGFHAASYNRRCRFNSCQHYFVQNEPRRSRTILKELGISPIEGEDLFEQDLRAKEEVLLKLRLQGWNGQPLFVLNPGAKFASQCWPAERFGDVARFINKEYAGFAVITGINKEKEIAESIVKNSPDNSINLAGKTSIQELVELLRISKACVTNDTGTMHIAAMTDVPTVALFSMRIGPAHWFPLGNKILALCSDIECKYCYNDDCKDNKCLKAIEVKHVLEALKAVLL